MPLFHSKAHRILQLAGSSNAHIAGGEMWGFLVGIYLAMMVYPFVEDWYQQRLDKTRLAKMREHHSAGRKWDVAKGEWI